MRFPNFRLSRKAWLFVIAAIATVGAVAYHFIDEELSRGREILGPNVRVSNLETFKEQLTRDLPIGTPRHEVEARLKRRKIEYSAPPAHWYRGTITAGWEVPGGIPLLPTHLGIRIELDDNNRLEEIRFCVSHDK